MKHHEIVKSCPSLLKSTHLEPRCSKELTLSEDLCMSYLSISTEKTAALCL